MTLQALDPIYVDFFLPQQALAEIKVGQAVTAKVDTYPDQKFAGKISAINPQVDTASRNVQVRATFGNPDEKLLPGMFATVDIDVGAPQHYVTLPQTAIAYNSYGNIVYVVEDKGKDENDGQKQMSRSRCSSRPARPRRPGRGPERRQGGRCRRDRRPDQAAQRLACPDQQRACNGSFSANPRGLRRMMRAAMNFTDIFIRRPVLATVVSLLILVLGLRAMGSLPVLQYPRTENAVVTVTTTYYGADPDVIAGFITTPLENAIAQANGIDYMSSTSASGVSTITVNLRLNYDADKALTEINTKVSSVLNQLPAGHAAAGADGAGRPDHRRHVYRLRQRRAGAATRSPTTSCASCSPSCRRCRACRRRKSSARRISRCAPGSIRTSSPPTA